MARESTVVEFRPIREPSRPRPLTDGEIVRLRAMLDGWDQVTTQCPVARSIVSGREL